MSSSFITQIEKLYSEHTDRIPSVDELKETIASIVSDAASDLMYYDRRECSELPHGVIELMIEEGHLTEQDLADMFLEGIQ